MEFVFSSANASWLSFEQMSFMQFHGFYRNHRSVGRFLSKINTAFFQVVAKRSFQVGATMVKFHFTDSKLREKYSSTKNIDRKISSGQECLGLPCTPAHVQLLNKYLAIVYTSGPQTFFVGGPLWKLINIRGAVMKPKFSNFKFYQKIIFK